MDVEDEDEEGADSQNASADQDGLETSMASQESAEAQDEVEEEGETGAQKTEKHLESEEALDVSQDIEYGKMFCKIN